MEQVSDSSKPFFSVILPVYNAAHLVMDALQSVLSQTFTDWEVVVVDDASSDHSLEVIQKAFGDNKKIRVFPQAVNKGAAAARNAALKEARADWCCFLDSDNEMLPGYMEEVFNHVSKLDDRYGIFWTGCNRIHHLPGGRIEHEQSFYSIKESIRNNKIEFLKNLKVGTGTALTVKRKYILEAGLFDESLKAAEDTDLMFRLIWKCDFASSNKFLYNYHVYHNKADRLTTNYSSQFASYKVIYQKNKDLLMNNDGLMKRVLSKLIRYAIFSGQKTGAYSMYVKQYTKKYGHFNKLILLHHLSSLPGGGLFIYFYKKISKSGKSFKEAMPST